MFINADLMNELHLYVIVYVMVYFIWLFILKMPLYSNSNEIDRVYDPCLNISVDRLTLNMYFIKAIVFYFVCCFIRCTIDNSIHGSTMNLFFILICCYSRSMTEYFYHPYKVSIIYNY